MVGKKCITCSKCGVNSTEDSSLTFHRFPSVSSRNLPLKAKVWAKYCFPNEDWSTNESLDKLYNQNKFLCGKHFDESSFTNSERNRLNKFAIPFEAKNIMAQVRAELQISALDTQETQVVSEVQASTSQCTSTSTEDLIDECNPQASNMTKKHLHNPPPSMEQPVIAADVCRCCLGSGGSRDLMETYSDENGSQVLLDILKDCLGITLSNILERGLSRLVCHTCAESLHKMHLFKQQVIAAEKVFVEYYKKVGDNNVDLSIVEPEESLDMDYDEMDIKDHKYCQVDDPFAIPPWGKPVKAISDRKKMKSTCETVLQHTTACPFRHYKSWFKCFYCTIDFIEFDTLREHTLKNHRQDDVAILKSYPKMLQIDITVLECKLCNVNLTDVKNMIKHFAEVHLMTAYKECIADYKLNSKPFTCHLCSKQYHVFRCLTVHLNEHYKNCICDVCGKSFLNIKRLRVHKRTHETGNFPCNKCGKVLKTKSSQANHMETHTKRVLKCHLCLKTMKHYNERIIHMSKEHNITNNFKCVICGRDFKVKHYLATHMRQTHGYKNKECPECGIAFVTNHGLKKHMLKHTGVKAFACNVCSKSYSRRYNLKEHMRSHETEVKFAGS